MSKIFLYGAPGSGKTTISRYLRTKLHYSLVEADYLREVVAQKDKTEDEDPFLYVGVKDAWRNFGEPTEENIIKGLLAVRKSMQPYVIKETAKHDSLIMEAAFLDPVELQKYGKTVLTVTSDDKRHEDQYFQHREKDMFNKESFKAALMLKKYFIEEAKELNIEIIENDDDLEKVVNSLKLE